MPRITRRHFLAASLGLPPLLLTCSQPNDSSLQPASSAVPRGSGSRLPLGQATRETHSSISSPAPKEPVVLWHFAWDDPLERRLWFTIRQQLEADLPHIQLSQEFYQRPVEEMVAISAAAGIPPAVASIQDMFFPHWVERNLYVNIQTFASKWLDGFTTSDIPTAALKAFRYYPEAKRTGVGDHYGLPWRSNPRLPFVNVDMLRESGLSDLLNQERWTLETAQEAALQLAQIGPDNRLSKAGIGFPDSWFHSLPWLWSGGGDVLDETGRFSTLELPEVERSYQILQDWRHALHVAPQVGEFTSDTYVQHFASNRLAMFLGTPRDMYRLRSVDVTWRAKPLFPIGEGESQTLALYDGLAIVTGTEQIDAAWEFATWAMRSEVQGHVLESEQALPVLSEVLASSRIEPHYIATLLSETHPQRSLPITATFPLYSPVIAHHYHTMMNGGHGPVPDALRKLHSLLGFILERQTLPSEWQ